MAVPKILFTPVWDRILYMNAIKSKSIALTDNHPEPCTSPLRLEPLQNKISQIKTVELIWDSRHLCMICFGLQWSKHEKPPPEVSEFRIRRSWRRRFGASWRFLVALQQGGFHHVGWVVVTCTPYGYSHRKMSRVIEPTCVGIIYSVGSLSHKNVVERQCGR